MEYETLDGAILAVLPENAEVLSIVQHGSTNWSTGLRVDILDGEDEKSYFVKIIEREELVGMAEAEYEGQKAIASVIPENAVKPVAWGYFSDTKAKAWFMAEYCNLRARAPPLEQFLPIVKQMHEKSVSPTGKFGFHVTPYYGPPPMTVDWTENWEEFWVREFRSGLKYVQSMRGEDPELVEIAEDFIEKVASRLLRPLQTGGRNIKPSLCHGDLWDGNIQFNVDTQQPVIFDPCSFYGHHEMDFQCMRSPRYIIGQNFIDLYKVKVGASQPSEDFEDRVALYSVRNDLMVAGMWPQWASLVDKAKDEMRHLLEKYPDGLSSFKGSLVPTLTKSGDQDYSEQVTAENVKDDTHSVASSDSGIGITSSPEQRSPVSGETPDTTATTAPKATFKSDIYTPSETLLQAQHSVQNPGNDNSDSTDMLSEISASAKYSSVDSYTENADTATPELPDVRSGPTSDNISESKGSENDSEANLQKHVSHAVAHLRNTQDQSAEPLEAPPLEVPPLEVTEPEVTPLEVSPPEGTEPEVSPPEASSPEVSPPEVSPPEVTPLAVKPLEETEPEVTEPEVTEPEVTEPEDDEQTSFKSSEDGPAADLKVESELPVSASSLADQDFKQVSIQEEPDTVESEAPETTTGSSWLFGSVYQFISRFKIWS